MNEKVTHISLSELIEKHRHNGGAASTYEFSHLWITGADLSEGDLSGIIIKDSTFSDVDFAHITLTNAKLSNVQFEAASHVTIACSGKQKPHLKSGVVAQQLTLPLEPSSAISVVSATQPTPDLSTVMQKLRTLNDWEIRRLIEKSKRCIQESHQPGKRSQYRPEQERFRKDLLDGYHHQCAITRVEEENILQAAHIIPFCLLEVIGAGQFGNSRWNGVLLRQELHTLFDRNTLTIAENGAVSANSSYQGLYNHWEQFVLPPRPACSDDPQSQAEHEQVWRSFLQWRLEEYDKYC
jgi:hypothetical protein